MTKDEVLDGFSFANPGEADMLQRWLDDATTIENRGNCQGGGAV